MFEIRPSLRHVEAGRDQVIALSSSINHPHVAVPGRASQKAEAFVVEIREASDLYMVLISLWLDQDQEQVIYGAAPVDGEGLEDLRQEAAGFCESMGFIMEELPFLQLDPPSQDELLLRLPPFGSQRYRLGGSFTDLEGKSSDSPSIPHRRGAVEPDALDRLGRFLARF